MPNLFLIKWDFQGQDALRAALYCVQQFWVLGRQHKMFIDPSTGRPCLMHTYAAETAQEAVAMVNTEFATSTSKACHEYMWQAQIGLAGIGWDDYMRRVAETVMSPQGLETLAEIHIQNWASATAGANALNEQPGNTLPPGTPP